MAREREKEGGAEWGKKGRGRRRGQKQFTQGVHLDNVFSKSLSMLSTTSFLLNGSRPPA